MFGNSKRICNVIFSLFAFLTKDCLSLKSLFIKVPEIVKSGETVTLTCEYDLEQAALYTIKWYKNDEEFFRFVPKESPPFKAFPVRYINVDVFSSGATKVTLIDVTKEMTGDYNCEVSADAPLFHTGVRGAHMIVAELPAGNPVLNIEPGKVEIGKKIIAECYSPGSFPVAQLTWYINDDQITDSTENIKLYSMVVHTDREINLHSSKSKIEIIANQTYFNTGVMALKCEASIHSIWNSAVDGLIKDETPLLAPVLGSTSSQSVDDITFDIFTQSGSTTVVLSSQYKSFGSLFLLYLFVKIR